VQVGNKFWADSESEVDGDLGVAEGTSQVTVGCRFYVCSSDDKPGIETFSFTSIKCEEAVQDPAPWQRSLAGHGTRRMAGRGRCLS
jgi:hypothetical protein